MRRILLFIFLFCYTAIVSAQDACNDAAIMSVKGSWKKKNDANMNGGKDITEINKRLDNISELFKSAYPEPKGNEAGWYRTMSDNSIMSNGPVAYNFNSLYQGWYCNVHMKKMMLSDETGTWAFVYINHYGWFMSSQYDMLNIKVNGNPVYTLPIKKGTWKNYTLYPTSSGGDRSNCIILTRNGQVPWKPVSQQQYLEATLAQLKEQRMKTSDGYTIQENNLRKSMADTKNNKNLKDADKEKMNAFFQKELDDLEKTKDDHIAKMNKGWDDKINAIENYMKQTDAGTLQGPAMIDHHVMDDFKGKFPTEEQGGHMLVVADPGYFNTKLPHCAPQFIVLLWTWDNKTPALDFKKQFEDNFPVEKLQAMLDK